MIQVCYEAIALQISLSNNHIEQKVTHQAALHQKIIPKYRVIQPEENDMLKDGISSMMKDCIISFRKSYDEIIFKIKINFKINKYKNEWLN